MKESYDYDHEHRFTEHEYEQNQWHKFSATIIHAAPKKSFPRPKLYRSESRNLWYQAKKDDLAIARVVHRVGNRGPATRKVVAS